MDTTHEWPAGRLVDLDEPECWELLGSVPVGRLVWQSADGLTVVPVNFAAADGEIHLQTGAYSALARECNDNPVAFQVDDVDAYTRSGWSVLVRGTARLDYGRVSDPDREPDPWPSGSKALHVVVPATSVTGRRLLPS